MDELINLTAWAKKSTALSGCTPMDTSVSFAREPQGEQAVAEMGVIF